MAFKLDPQFGLGYYPDDLALRYYNKEAATKDLEQKVLQSLRRRVMRRAAVRTQAIWQFVVCDVVDRFLRVCL